MALSSLAAAPPVKFLTLIFGGDEMTRETPSTAAMMRSGSSHLAGTPASRPHTTQADSIVTSY
jgi:hypothetical protein